MKSQRSLYIRGDKRAKEKHMMMEAELGGVGGIQAASNSWKNKVILPWRLQEEYSFAATLILAQQHAC